MEVKWVARWLEHARVHASFSPCPRNKVGAWIIYPETNSPISSGYNGPPRKGVGNLCGGFVCLRDDQNIKSGTQTEVGCHHAEANALMNALRTGANVMGAHLIVSSPPCLSCAKLIHHAGIKAVHTTFSTAYGEGVRYLHEHDIPVMRYDLPSRSFAPEERTKIQEL